MLRKCDFNMGISTRYLRSLMHGIVKVLLMQLCPNSRNAFRAVNRAAPGLFQHQMPFSMRFRSFSPNMLVLGLLHIVPDFFLSSVTFSTTGLTPRLSGFKMDLLFPQVLYYNPYYCLELQMSEVL